VLVCYASAAGTVALYPTAADQTAAAEAINSSPAVVALYGPILDVHSLGELAMTKMTVLYAVFVGVFFLVVVRRHTRVEEESGRTELVGGTAVGRSAPIAGAAVESVVLAVVLGLLAAAANVLGGLPLVGSLAFGASWTGVGLTVAGMTAVACQLSASARTCGAIAAGMLGTAYVLRAVGDTSVSWLSWLSPLGWSTQLRAYSDPRWWVLALYVALAAALLVLAFALDDRRDLGSGMLAARPGPATGSPRLADAIALAVRVHTPTFVVWSAGTVVLGFVMGSIAPNIGDLLDSPGTQEMMQRLGGQGAIEQTLIAAVLSIAAAVLCCFGISVVVHAGADEGDGRTEQVLATATSRVRTWSATVLVAVAGATALLALLGVAVALGYGGAGDGIGAVLGDVVGAALGQAPAVWVVTALAAACLAWRRSAVPVAWGLLVLFLTLGQIGELLDLPSWLLGLSPFSHVPAMPVEDFDPASAAALTGVAVLLLGLSWLRYRSRDIS